MASAVNTLLLFLSAPLTGRANLRNFFLFLVWAEAAVLYCIAMAGGLLYKERDILLEGFRLALTNCAKR